MPNVGEAPRPSTPVAPRRPSQLLLAAELGALVRRGGLRSTVSVAVAAALALGVSAIAVLNLVGASELAVGSGPAVTVPVEVTSATAAVVFSIGVVMHIGRAVQHGSFALTLSVVPDRSRTYLAKLGALCLLAAGTTFAALVVVAGSALLVAGRTAGFQAVAVALLSGPLAAAAVSALAFAIGVLSGRAAAGLLALMAWWILVPLALLVVQELLPDWLGSVSQVVSASAPTVLLARATTVSTLETAGLGDVLEGLMGLSAWLAVLLPLSYLVFRRRSL